MISSLPGEILAVIVALALVAGLFFLIAAVVFRKKQDQEVDDEPEEIKKMADDPERPHEGQEDKPIDT